MGHTAVKIRCHGREGHGSQGGDRLHGFTYLEDVVFISPDHRGMVEAGFKQIKELWTPIFDVFDQCGVKFALEVHPTEIAFDYYSTQKLLEVFEYRETLGINLTPAI